MSFAENTEVSVEKTRSDIERTLAKYGATEFCYGWKPDGGVVMFRVKKKDVDRSIRFFLPLPAADSEKYRWSPERRKRRTPDQARAAWEQDCRSRWRALLLCIKAKLESVASKIESFEEAFLPHIVLSDGTTIGEAILPQLGKAATAGGLKLLPGGTDGATP